MSENKPPPKLEFLLRIIDEAYDRKAWHGPNVRGSIRGLSAGEAGWRPAPGRHNIWEIVLHVAYWKYAVRRRLLGEKRGSFPVKGSNWFACPTSGSEKEWRANIALLEQQHRRLLQAIEALPPGSFDRPAGAGKASYARTVVGVALHDVYHAGQIQLLKRLQRTPDAESRTASSQST